MILIKNMNNIHIRIKMPSANEGQAQRRERFSRGGVNQRGIGGGTLRAVGA